MIPEKNAGLNPPFSMAAEIRWTIGDVRAASSAHAKHVLHLTNLRLDNMK